jgi:hypothetical protein
LQRSQGITGKDLAEVLNTNSCILLHLFSKHVQERMTATFNLCRGTSWLLTLA